VLCKPKYYSSFSSLFFLLFNKHKTSNIGILKCCQCALLNLNSNKHKKSSEKENQNIWIRNNNKTKNRYRIHIHKSQRLQDLKGKNYNPFHTCNKPKSILVFLPRPPALIILVIRGQFKSAQWTCISNP
jgi:hypothetical protein